jgi:hypothetical protein
MNPEYLKYGLIGGAILVVLYLFSRGQSAPSSGAVAVEVQYAGPDDSASIGARAQAFSELVGLGALTISEESELEQAQLANATAREIARYDTALGKYTLDVGREVDAMRGRQAMDLARFQAGQVNYLAESFRQKDIDRQATVLNALTSIWGAQPVYSPERERTSTAEFINALSSGVSKLFTFGLG